MSEIKRPEKMLKAELVTTVNNLRDLLAGRNYELESERNAFDQLAMVSAKHEASIGELFALLAEAHGLRQNGGYHDDDAERWSAWDNRASELLTHHREGTPLPFRTAEEAELALERMTAERDAWKEQAVSARKSLWHRVWAR